MYITKSDEELRSVGSRTGVGHGEETGLVVLVVEVLVSELLSVDGLAASAVASGEVSTLSHEVRDDSVEGGALVVKGLAGLADALLSSAEAPEVLRGLGGVLEQAESDPAGGSAPDGDVEEDSGVVSCHGIFKLLNVR